MTGGEDPFNFLDELQRIRNEYDPEDLLMDEEYDLLGEAVGAIETFYNDASELRGSYRQDEEDVSQVMSAGIGWVEAHAAHNAIEQLIERGAMTDKIWYGVLSDGETIPGQLGENARTAVDRTADILTDAEEIADRYARGRAHAESVTQSMRLDDEEPTPADIARERAEEQGYDEFLEYLDELEEEMHDDYGEFTDHLREVAEQELGPADSP